MAALDELQHTLEQMEAALRQFVNGTPTAFKACWSHADDVTIFGGWGA